MCGFIGEYVFNAKDKSNFVDLTKILKLSFNRGPNHSGSTSKDNFQLGFNRLSIQDLSDMGNQPMQSSCERYHMVFNGEVYNFNQLKIDFNLSTFIVILHASLVVSVVGHAGMFYLYRFYPVATVLPFYSLFPIFGIILTYLMLKEVLTMQQFIGGVMVIGSVYLIHQINKKEALV